MNNPDLTDRIIAQGRALVRAIEPAGLLLGALAETARVRGDVD